MRGALSLVLAACALVLGNGPAAAQEVHRVGLTAGYPAAVGLVWQVSDRFALRPDVSITRTATNSRGGFDSETTTDSWSVGVGLSGLIYITSWEDLRAYLSPRFAYTRYRATSDYYAWNHRDSTKGRNYALSGSFGAEYTLARRFSVYFEAGLGYSDQHQRGSYSYNDESSWSTRTAVGAVFYF